MYVRWPRQWRRASIVVGAGVVVALTAGGVALAAQAGSTPSPKPTPSAGTTHPNRPFGHGPGFGFRLPGLGPLGGRLGGNVLYGQATVAKAGGGYETLLFRRGTAAVSGSQITVTSADHTSQVFTTGSSTIVDAGTTGLASIKNGDNVLVVATGGAAPAAEQITDLTLIRSTRPAWAPGAPPPGDSGSSSSSSTAPAQMPPGVF